MKHIKHILAAVLLAAASGVQAQPGLVNTLDATAVGVGNAARQSSTEIDAVINNPAGTAFLGNGFHLSVSGIYSWQRVNNGLIDDNDITQLYRQATNRFTPSVQAAWTHNRWTVSGSWACEGGYGRLKNDKVPHMNGATVLLGAYAPIAELNYKTALANLLNAVMIPGIDVDTDDTFAALATSHQSKLYNWTGRLGIAYKINDKLSVYAGAKLSYLYGHTASDVNMVMLRPSAAQVWSIADYWNAAADRTLSTELSDREELAADMRDIAQVEFPTMRYTLKQNKLRIAPVLGIHYRTGAFNIGARYEFKSHLCGANGMVDEYADAVSRLDGYDLPDLLTVGADWQVAPRWNVALGGSASFTSNHAYGNTWKGLVGDFNAGYPKDKPDFTIAASLKFDVTPKLSLTAGAAFIQQKGLVNNGNYDMLVPSIRYGRPSLGCSYNITDKCQLVAGVNAAFGKAALIPRNNITMHGVTESGTAIEQTVRTREYGQLKHSVSAAIGVNYSF